MSIVSQRIVEVFVTGQGYTVLRLGFTDHTGKERVIRRHTSEDPATYLAAQVSVMESSLSKIEIREAKGRLRKGEDVVEIYNSTQHTSKGDIKLALLEEIAVLEIEKVEVKSITDSKQTVEGLK